MLNRKPMKPLFLLTLIIFGFTTRADNKPARASVGPIANAGADQTIYLTQTSSVTLNGSASSGDSYQWTDVSTDYTSGATITSPNSAVTTVTGLPQGTWYFQLAVTSGGSTSTDVVVINVDYDLPPAGTLLRTLEISNPDVAAFLNDRSNTNQMSTYYKTLTTSQGPTYYEMCRANGMMIDNPRGKFYATIEDGYYWTGGGDYARTEVSYGNAYTLDPAKTYCFEWKGYYPQDFSTLAANTPVLSIFQIHGDLTTGSDGVPFEIDLVNGHTGTNNNNGVTGVKGLYFVDNFYTDPNIPYHTYWPLIDLSDMINKAHTIRVTLKEGEAGTGAFIKVEIDGVQKYYRNTGKIGASLGTDYPKFAGIYDYGSALVDPNNHTRGRTFSLVTEAFNIYNLDGNSNQSPNADAGKDQTINLPTNRINLNGSGNDPDGSISSYLWTIISGPSGSTIGDPSSASTTVSGLKDGVYQFQLQVTDNDGATGTAMMQITVNSAPNISPTAKTGPDQTITLPTNSVSITGSGTDSDGTILSYSWKKKVGPTGGTIGSPNTATTIISNLSAGIYQYELTVTDNQGATGTATIKITVNPGDNQPPVAIAGNNQALTLPTNSITLAGSGSDADGTIKAYAWTKISGPSGSTIVNPNSANTIISGLVRGVYQFELTVTDNKGGIGTDTLQVRVNAANNIAPVANVGNNQTVTLPTNSVTLSGNGTDADGTIVAYLWTKKAGPAGSAISLPSSSSTTVNGLIQGDYTFELTVTDNQGATGTDTVHIKVNPAINIAPSANAGSNQTIVLPTDNVTLRGSGNDPDGAVASYTWAKITGPSGSTIVNPNSANTIVSGLVQGVYQFELTVTDSKGAVGKDTVKVIVNSPVVTQQTKVNIAPTANAGSDITTVTSNNSVDLKGSGSDADGSISTYSWMQISGPSSSTIISSDSANTEVQGLIEGTYEFELQVKDNEGAEAKDTVQVTVGLERLAPEDLTGNLKVYPNPVHTITNLEVNTGRNNTCLLY